MRAPEQEPRPEIRGGADRGTIGASLLLGAAVLASRVPFLGPGFGVDPDAWRVAEAARYIRETGAYGGSRPPGHPVQEILSAYLWPGGSGASPADTALQAATPLNAATAVASVVAVLCFAVLLRRLRVPHANLAALALGAVPAIYLNSVCALDYVWALALLLAALALAASGRALLAGLCLGLAIGCRIGTVVYVPIVAWVFLWWPQSEHRIRSSLLCAAAAGLVAALCYAPALQTYGLRLLQAYQLAYPNPIVVLKQATLDVWGTLGFGALLVAAAVLAARRRALADAAPAEQRARRQWSLLALLFVLTTVAAYLPMPHEAGYLVPAVPFVLLFFGLWLPRATWLGLLAALCLAPFVGKLADPATSYAPPPPRASVPVTLAGRPVRFEPFRGPVPYDHARRGTELAYARGLVEGGLMEDGPVESDPGTGPRRLVVVHEWLPMIRVLYGSERVGATRFVASLPLDSLRAVRQRGTPVYFVPEAEWPNRLVHGYHLGEEGARPLSGSR